MTENIATQLYQRVEMLAHLDPDAADVRNKNLHAALAQVCYEGVKDTGMAFGNLFSQVDYICRAHAIQPADMADIQTMRRHSNSAALITAADWAYDLRALALLVSAVTATSIPSTLSALLPHTRRPIDHSHAVNRRYVRCVVTSFTDSVIQVYADATGRGDALTVDYTAHSYLQPLLRVGMQLNLIDCRGNDTIEPSIIVVEPDYLVDISQIARCFTEYGHHPLSYLVNRLSPVANSQAILLGNFAGRALDDIINRPDDYKWTDTLRTSFRERALDYCTCPDFSGGDSFRTAAKNQVNNLRGIVDGLFATPADGSRRKGYNRTQAMLEPSFVCERLGLQGRIDLMTTDMRLLVEQKSGKNYNIECGHPNKYGSYQKEDHYVQLLLYAALLQQNFNLGRNHADIRLLYSKYPLPGGLVAVNGYQALFREAMALRNRVVAQDYALAHDGFDSILDSITPETLNEYHVTSRLYTAYVYPKLQELLAPLHALSSVERAYFCTMATFVLREQLAAKVGSHEGVSTSMADLWNMPIETKREMGNIYTGLTIIDKQKSNGSAGWDTITLAVPDQGEDFLPNFRPGDSVYLYAYQDEPSPTESILFKGVIVSLHPTAITIHLNDGQQNEHILAQGTYAVEHSGSDGTFTAQLRSLCNLMHAPGSRRSLLLSQSEPTADLTRTLSRQYHATYDDILLKVKQANNFFLLVGPPGTGKTSMALRFMVEEALQDADAQLLLTSYTNRAVDEISGMLADAGIDFLRIGGRYTCDARFHSYLLDQRMGDNPKLSDVRHILMSARVVVATTTTLQSRAQLFGLRHFTLAIVDEASQILEPSVVDLLARVDKFVMVGDYKQLPAVVQQPSSLSAVTNKELNDIYLTDCRHSLFERLYRREMALGRSQFIGILRRQGRMHPEIARFPNEMFYRREHLECVPLPHQQEDTIYPSPLPLDANALDRLLYHNRLLYFPSPDNLSARQSDKVNPAEARTVAQIVERVYGYYGTHFDSDKTIGVIVPYRNQIAMIRREIAKAGIPALDRISIDTVERYQGSQRDVIIYSFTVQHAYQIDFLTANCFEEDGQIIDRKLNVALTRARKQLVITGHESTLRRNAIFSKLIDTIQNTQNNNYA